MSDSNLTIITGSASGMGRATVRRLRSEGKRVLGIDLRDADVCADLATDDGRFTAIQAIEQLGELGAIATFAGVSGFGGRPGSQVVAINYFGTVALMENLRWMLAIRGGRALAVSSNAATTTPGISEDLVEACLDGDEEKAKALGQTIGGPGAYAATKLAIARWVRRSAPRKPWAGAGICLNAIAPGHVETALSTEMLADPIARTMVERMVLPIGQIGTPDEIAALATLLLSDEARFIVGSVVYIDGGADAHYRSEDYPTARKKRTWAHKNAGFDRQ